MELLRSITLSVELSAGTDIRQAACDLCILANRVGVTVESGFNGVTLLVRPGENPLKLVDSYHEQLNIDSKYKIAQARD